MKKILHITNWYPNRWDNLEGSFVKEQYKLFSEVANSYLINVQVRESKRYIEYQHIYYSEHEEGYYLFTKIQSTKIKEFLTTFLLLWVLFKSEYKKYDLIHFHIAYPLLIHYYLWKKVIKIPILISEHWSAYHFNFYMPWSTKKLARIKNIFRQKIPLIIVSQSLLKDIEIFSDCSSFKSTVIPNVIDQKVFYCQNLKKSKVATFFAVNNWREIKNPFPMLEGFALLHDKKIDFLLIIGGYGELIEKMKDIVNRHKMSQKVQFLGKMKAKEIALTLARSDAYLISSHYETFSMVSAQALCCGVPLIGSRLFAIEEYTNSSDYLRLDKNWADEWSFKLIDFIKNRESYKHKEIALRANIYLNNYQISLSYREILNEWFNR